MRPVSRTTAGAALAWLALGTVGLAQPPADAKKPPTVTEEHYRVYDADGADATLDKLLERMREADVVFVGEHHDDPVAHHLQALLLRRFHEQRACSAGKPRPLALSLEMFERDVQFVVDEYLAGLITEQHFRDSGRAWKNYEKDYRPLVEYAREHKLPVVAANAPRRYVNLVGRLGAGALKDVAEPQRRGLPPLPYAEASPAYAAKFKDVMSKMKRESAPKELVGPPTPDREVGPPTPVPPPKPPDLTKTLQAQSLWDATMAYSVAEFLMKSPRAQVLHVNGGFHSEKRLGVPEHLLRYRPGTSLMVVTILSHKAFPKFDPKEMEGLGDFVIVTDALLPRSFDSKPAAK